MLRSMSMVTALFGSPKSPQVFLTDVSCGLRYAGALKNAAVGKVDGEDPYANYLQRAVTQLRWRGS